MTIVVCPHCQSEIALTESVLAPVLEAIRCEYQQRLALKDAEVASCQAALQAREGTLANALDSALAEKLRQERPRIAAEEARKLREVLAADLDHKSNQIAELEAVLQQRELKLAQAQRAQTELLRKRRELENGRRELELTVEQRVSDALKAARVEARDQAAAEFKLKVLEREQTIVAMQRQIEVLRHSAEQGSEHLRGEVQELALEAELKSRFPHDTIEPVAKGERGADLLQRVTDSRGRRCGTVIWECKRTKRWSDGWLTKLRDDQRAARAETAIIVSEVLPEEVALFDLVQGVWVSQPRAAVALAAALRQSLLELAATRQAIGGRQSGTELVYQYVTGARFRQRVQAMVEVFSSMHEDLNREKRAIIRLWAKREQQIERVMQATAGMYGDLQGMTGRSLKEIAPLDLESGTPHKLGT